MTTLYMMIGLPASGKGHFANILANEKFAFICEADGVRKQLYGDASIQGDPKVVFDALHTKILTYLRDDLDVIFDATNISYKKRMEFLRQVPEGVIKTAVMVYCPVGECMDNQRERERQVPHDVIVRMWKNFDVPFDGEGWDSIIYINNNRNPVYKPVAETIWKSMVAFEQDNPHHAFTVGGHCDEVVSNLVVEENSYDAAVLTVSAKWHDNGKVWTKVFHNMKGETTEIAHYYNHENVGSYEMVGMLLNADGITNPAYFITDVSTVVRFHMRPYMIPTEKARKKFHALVGDKVYTWVITLNEADREGKGDSE